MTSAQADLPSSASARWPLAAGLLVVTLAAFAAVWRHGFVSVDDHIYVTDNARVLAGLTWSGVGWAFTTTHANFWHPLTWLSLMLDVQLFGANPGAMHVTNLLFHLANTVLWFVVLSRMTGAPGPSALVAGLFAVHPLHVESVAWISARKDVLSTFFLLLALWCYAVYVDDRRKGERGALAYAGVLGLFALGLMAKPMLVTLPFVMLLLDWWPLGRASGVEARACLAEADGEGGRVSLSAAWRSWAPLVREKLPLFALAAASGVVAYLAQERGGAVAGLAAFPLTGRLANALHSYVAYIGQMFWPVGLAAFYPYPQVTLVWPAVAAAFTLAAITVAAVLLARHRPHLAVGWFWYVGTLLPVSGLVQVGSHAMADRYTYVPLVGLFVMAAWGVADLPSRARLPRRALAVASCVLLLACAALTRAQVATWRDSTALWQHAIDVMPDNYYAHNGLGLELARQGRHAEAKAHFAEAVRLAPGFPNGHNNLGQALAGENRLDEALAEFRTALALNPDYPQAHTNLGNALLKARRPQEAVLHFTEAIRVDPDSADARTNLGSALLEASRPAAAIEQLTSAVALRPGSAAAHYDLANALQRVGGLEEAVEHYRMALALQPATQSVETRNNLGATLVRMGRLDEAAAEFDQALRIDPRSTQALNNLGSLLLQTGRPAAAADKFRDAIRLEPASADAHMNLGNALADMGRLAEAEREQRLAVRLAPESADAHYNLGSTLEQRGRLDEAAQYNETLRLEGPSPDIHYALGWTLERLGRARDAEAQYREVLRLSPGNAEAAARLARLALR
jgi:tetratricopeptide (TPR) repeat protein